MIISGFRECFKVSYCPAQSFQCALDCIKMGNQHGGDCAKGLPACCCNPNVWEICTSEK